MVSYDERLERRLSKLTTDGVSRMAAMASLAMEVTAVTHRPAFIASNTFEGAKLGMVFQNGALGIGYYPDVSVGAPSSTTSLRLVAAGAGADTVGSGAGA